MTQRGVDTMAPATGRSARHAPAPCDLLVFDGYILTMDEERRVFADGAVAIRDGRILEVGPSADLRARYAPAETIDAAGAPVHPGFIDGHYHAGLHLSRGCITDNPHPAADEGAGPGVFTRWINALTDEDEHASALMASVEMVKNGFTGFVEAATAFEPDAVGSAAEAVGIRCTLADCMIWDIIGGEPMAADIPRAPCDPRRAQRLLGQQVKRNREPDALVRGHVALYGLGSGSEELLHAAKNLADAHGTVFHQHQNFTPEDRAFDVQRFGRPPLVHFAETGLLGPNVVFTHMNALDEAEAEAVIDSGMAVVWHPGNAMYYGIARATQNRMPALYRRGTSLTFGTDVAKVWAFGELGFIAYLLTREGGDYLSSDDLLTMFTRGGARAFGAPGELGILEAGKRADLVIRTNDLPDAQPNADPVRQMMLVSRTKSVDSVIVNGEVVVRHGELTRLDEQEVYATARESMLRMAGRIGLPVRNARLSL
jgi:5-methylthioadenosine/S-adenosylhomocysteine deaminase